MVRGYSVYPKGGVFGRLKGLVGYYSVLIPKKEGHDAKPVFGNKWIKFLDMNNRQITIITPKEQMTKTDPLDSGTRVKP